MELPEPYHSLPFDRWRKMMKAFPRSYATAGARHWLQTRRKFRLQHEMQNTEPFTRPQPLTPGEIEALRENKQKSAERLEVYYVHASRARVEHRETPPKQ